MLTIKTLLKIAIFSIFIIELTNAKMLFLSKEQLVKDSQFIVVAKAIDKQNTGKTSFFRDTYAKVIDNQLIVLESIKGKMNKNKTFSIYTLKYDDWMEDNVELPSKGEKVLLFLKKDKEGKLKPVNGIQGVWNIKKDGKTGYGSLKEFREIVKREKNSSVTKKRCNSKAFADLLDTAEVQTQAGRYKEALESYRKAYRICPMKDLEEQMAWLMGEVGDTENKGNGRLENVFK